jgi:hypothetical protein
VTPYRLLTLLALTAVMRYQAVPVSHFPAQLACQAPPDTATTTTTLVPAGMLTFDGALADGLVRRFVAHSADFVTDAPSTSPGTETAVTAKAKIADRRAVESTADGDA